MREIRKAGFVLSAALTLGCVERLLRKARPRNSILMRWSKDFALRRTAPSRAPGCTGPTARDGRGITKDLEWMKRVGIAGFQISDVAAGSGQVVDKKITSARRSGTTRCAMRPRRQSG